MTDSFQMRVRFDPRPVIRDPRALISYHDVPEDRTQAIRERLMREMAARLGIPKSLLEGGGNYSSARFDLDRMDYATKHFLDTARRRLLLDIKRMAMLRYQIDFYLRHHQRLPGSTRTKRLRKKRITKVQAFCARRLKLWSYS